MRGGRPRGGHYLNAPLVPSVFLTLLPLLQLTVVVIGVIGYWTFVLLFPPARNPDKEVDQRPIAFNQVRQQIPHERSEHGNEISMWSPEPSCWKASTLVMAGSPWRTQRI